jgi:hypothetical protein
MSAYADAVEHATIQVLHAKNYLAESARRLEVWELDGDPLKAQVEKDTRALAVRRAALTAILDGRPAQAEPQPPPPIDWVKDGRNPHLNPVRAAREQW